MPEPGDVETISEISALTVHGGPKDVGELIIKGKKTKSTSDVAQIPEAPRPKNRELFKTLPEQYPIPRLKPYYAVDFKLQEFADVCAELQNYDTLKAYFHGLDGYNEDNNVVPVFELVANTRSVKNAKVQQGSVLQVEYLGRWYYFFELTARGSETIGMHAMTFGAPDDERTELTVQHFASIFLKRINDNCGWPNRSQYSGDFYTCTVKHVRYDSSEKMATRMTNAISHLHRLCHR